MGCAILIFAPWMFGASKDFAAMPRLPKIGEARLSRGSLPQRTRERSVRAPGPEVARQAKKIQNLW